MLVYYTAIAAVLYGGLVSNLRGTRRQNDHYRYLICFLVVCVAGLRYKVGTDYGAYAGNYPAFVAIPAIELLNIAKESGIRLLAKLVSVFFNDYAAFIFACSLITVGLYLKTLWKYSPMFWLSILLYILLGEWQGSFNGVRQYLAAAILFAGHRYLFDRHLGKWSLTVLLALLFHISASIMFLLYFLPIRKITLKQAFLMIMITVLGSMSYGFLFSNISILKGEEIVLNAYALHSVNPLRLAVAWAPLLFYAVYGKRQAEMQKHIEFYVSLALINAVIMTISRNSALLFRISIYTNIFTALAWPYMLYTVPHKNKYIWVALISLFYGIYWISETGVNAQFFWIFQRTSSVYIPYSGGL